MKYKIGYISKISGVSPRTLRFYEQKGLLIPHKDAYTSYRYYNDDHINVLQQILLYKELDLRLDDILPLIKGMEKNRLIPILEQHLVNLNKKESRLQTVISTVESTIKSLKGEKTMKNDEKFEGLKDKLIKENDVKFKDDVIEKYGEEAYHTSKKAFKNMSKETFDRMNQLNEELFNKLKAYKNDLNNIQLEKDIFNLHKEWITIAWGSYNKDTHKGVSDLYVSDPRFTKYYDKHGEGLSKLLRDAIHKYAH